MNDLEIERECPACGNDTFYLVANMEIHLGTKTEWHCTEYDYGYIHVTGGIEVYAKTEV